MGGDQGDYGGTLAQYTAAKDAFAKAGGTSTIQYASLLMNIGSVMQDQGDYGGALVQYTAAKDACAKAGGTSTIDYANLLQNLQMVHSMLNSLPTSGPSTSE